VLAVQKVRTAEGNDATAVRVDRRARDVEPGAVVIERHGARRGEAAEGGEKEGGARHSHARVVVTARGNNEFVFSVTDGAACLALARLRESKTLLSRLFSRLRSLRKCRDPSQASVSPDS
jgi:hypothetical protein